MLIHAHGLDIIINICIIREKKHISILRKIEFVNLSCSLIFEKNIKQIEKIRFKNSFLV